MQQKNAASSFKAMLFVVNKIIRKKYNSFNYHTNSISLTRNLFKEYISQKKLYFLT